MNLSIPERIALLGVLPEQGNFVTLKIVHQLRTALSFSEDEVKRWSISQDGQRVTWDSACESGAEIPIGEKATDLIVEALKNLDQRHALTEQHFTIYEKFVIQ